MATAPRVSVAATAVLIPYVGPSLPTGSDLKRFPKWPEPALELAHPVRQIDQSRRLRTE